MKNIWKCIEINTATAIQNNTLIRMANIRTM